MKKMIITPKTRNMIICFETLAVFVLAVLALHDAGTATGTGYYLQLKTGMFTRETWDIIADGTVIILAVLLSVIPALVLGGKLTDVSLFALANIALTPLIRPDKLVTLLFGDRAVTFDEAYGELLAVLPSLILVLAMMLAVGVYENGIAGAKFIYLYTVVSAVLIIAGLMIPAASDICLFLSGYILLLPVIRYSLKKYEGSGVLSSILFLAGIWRMVSVMFAYHM